MKRLRKPKLKDGELRGYDISTIKFSIMKKKDNEE